VTIGDGRRRAGAATSPQAASLAGPPQGDAAGITGLVAIIAEHGSKGMGAPVLVIWVIVAVTALGAVALNKYRSTRRG
jgi:hypothetical protein